MMTTTSKKSLTDKFTMAVGYTINGVMAPVRAAGRKVGTLLETLCDINPLLVVFPLFTAGMAFVPAMLIAGGAAAEQGASFMGAMGIFAGVIGGGALAAFAIVAVAEGAKRGVQFLSKVSQIAQKDRQQKQALKKN